MRYIKQICDVKEHRAILRQSLRKKQPFMKALKDFLKMGITSFPNINFNCEKYHKKHNF